MLMIRSVFVRMNIMTIDVVLFVFVGGRIARERVLQMQCVQMQTTIDKTFMDW